MPTPRPFAARGAALLALPLLLALGACRQDMHDQPKYEAYEASAFFANDTSAQPIPEGTVARGQLREDEPYFTGFGADDQPVARIPIPVDERLLVRGRAQYDGFCAPCHDRVGSGQGMVVRRGFKQPSSFHIDRLRDERDGYFFDVITNGFGQMPSYAAQIDPEDRWAIVSYVRALQLSQNVPMDELSPDERQRAEAGGPPPAPDAQGPGYGAPGPGDDAGYPAERVRESASASAHGAGQDSGHGAADGESEEH
jgi:mono/diheme cytochrome c family protein